jgi:drug/metabolite transporter (DMT)-like permease
MAVTMPVGVVGFLVIAVLTGSIGGLADFTPQAVAWMTAVGLLHFLFGRYCNFRAAQEAGVNLTAPVIQLQVVVTLTLAVVGLREPCTLLQALGALGIAAGGFVAQRRIAGSGLGGTPTFTPRVMSGFLFALGAALAYGTTPVMVRQAVGHGRPTDGILGGVISYGAATVAFALAMAWPALRRNVMALTRENVRWFTYSGIFVALAQGFFYSAITMAPLMLVVPLMQLALVFRFAFSAWLNPEHEVFGAAVIIGTVISLIGALLVSVDTGLLLGLLHAPEPVAAWLGQHWP